MKVLLVTSGFVHPPFWGRMALHRALKSMEGFTFRHCSSLEKLPARLDEYAAMVLYFHHKTITDTALNRLDEFVHRGGGILAVHSATASFDETKHYFEILGGKFISHGAIEDFEVKRIKDELFAGIEPFIIHDELYIHELQPGIEAHFTAQHEGDEVPVVWTYTYGKGRVCYALPGHTTSSMQHPQVQEILRRGLKWACGAQQGQS